MEQVHDAQFAIKTLKQQKLYKLDEYNIGVIGYSWGGLAGAILAGKEPSVKALASLDGTETYYLGTDEADDRNVKDIFNYLTYCLHLLTPHTCI